MRDTEFLPSRKVLEGKAKKLRELGMGKRPNKAQSLTEEEEELLCENCQLGDKTPRSLINTIAVLSTRNLKSNYAFTAKILCPMSRQLNDLLLCFCGVQNQIEGLTSPSGQPPGHLNVRKIFVHISPSPGQKAVQVHFR